MKSRNSILGYINEHIAIFDPFEYVYLFGSVIDLYVDHNDIDILIIYAKYSDEIKNALQLVSSKLENEIGSIDLTALSIEEEREISFLDRIKPHHIRIK